MTSGTMQRRYQVTLLLDERNNWIEPFLPQLGDIDPDCKYNVSISYNPSQVTRQQIVFIIGYTKILDSDFLSKNDLNLIIHESDLPYGKGFSPVQWQILEGKKTIPVCLIEAVERFDAGDIILRDQIELDGGELYDDIRAKQIEVTFRLIREFLSVYPVYERLPQVGDQSIFPRRTAKDGELDPDKTIREQFNLLRIGNNEKWPSHFHLNGHQYILKIYKGKK